MAGLNGELDQARSLLEQNQYLAAIFILNKLFDRSNRPDEALSLLRERAYTDYVSQRIETAKAHLTAEDHFNALLALECANSFANKGEVFLPADFSELKREAYLMGEKDERSIVALCNDENKSIHSKIAELYSAQAKLL